METEDIRFTFTDKSRQPTEEEFFAALGPSLSLWRIYRNWLSSNYEGITSEWKFYSASTGWTQVFRYQEKTIFYFYPLDNTFCILFSFNDRAVFEARRSALPLPLISAIISAMKVGDNRAFFVQIHAQNDLLLIQRLLKIKIQSEK